MAEIVEVEGDRIRIVDLDLVDHDAARFVERTVEGRAALLRRALKIGLTALEQAGVTLDIEFVRREFDRLVARNEEINRKATQEVATILRASFGADGELPKTLAAYLGDEGRLTKLTADLFNEQLSTSAIARLRKLLGQYFDGDTSMLATLLDPTRVGSPLHQFAEDMRGEFKAVGEKLAAIEAARLARAEERAKGTAKGRDYEEDVHDELALLAHGTSDLLERTGDLVGSIPDCKKGDWVITIDPALTGGSVLRMVVEAKNRYISGPAMLDELVVAKENRGAAVALAVFHPDHVPAGVTPLQLVGSDVYCVFNPGGAASVELEAALRLARAIALTRLRSDLRGVDAAVIARCAADIQRQLAAFKDIRTKLAQIGSLAEATGGSLDELRAAIQRRVQEIEAELTASGGPPAATPVPLDEPAVDAQA